MGIFFIFKHQIHSIKFYHDMKQNLAYFYFLLSGILLSFSPSVIVSAQSDNLVINYSFEDFENCPVDYTPQDRSHKLVTGWLYPTIATPDYFNRCAIKNVGVPNNFAGQSEPKTGDAYVGAILSGTDDSYREYIQGKLRVPLIAGKQYCVTFSYKLASYSKFAVDQISLYFSEIEIKNDLTVNLPYNPQINNKEGLFLDNISEWEEICTVYVAKGGEQYFVIGNFESYDNTNYVVTDKNLKNLRDKSYAYYYFDDVIIRPLDNCLNCACVQHDFEAKIIDTYYTGGLDPVTGKCEKIINDGYIKIGVIGGTPPYSVEWLNSVHKGLELKNLPSGTYNYVVSDAFNCKATGNITFNEPEITKDEFEDDLRNIEEGSAIVLENIFFEFNKTTLLPQSNIELDKIAAFILDNNIKLIEISGHTDTDGSEKYNQELSEGRARSVVNYLVSKGINIERMRAVGYGESRPIETNLTEKGKAINRRVEFMLVKK